MAISPDRLPISRPDLPRASSAMSGFFFCGMMLDPVDHESCSVAKSNSRVVQRMTSSASRERSTPDLGGDEGELGGEVARRRAVDGVGRRAGEAELAPRPPPGRGRASGRRGPRSRTASRPPRARPSRAAARRRAAAATRGPAGGATGARAGRAGGACARASRRDPGRGAPPPARRARRPGRAPGRRSCARGRAGRPGRAWPPGRCASGPPGAGRRPRDRPRRAATARGRRGRPRRMVAGTRSPASYRSPSTDSPRSSSAWSASVSRPARCRALACAREPARS